jgi:hypothetical protein
VPGDLGSLTADDFEPCRGERFTVGAVAVTLAAVDRMGRRSGHRDPFSLLFRGPAAPVLPQGGYQLEHQALGRLELFLVPIGADADAVTYEAIFT